MKEKQAKKNKLNKQCQNSFRGLDYFGQEINFTWNGESQYKTTFGASISFVLMIILLAYGVYRLFFLVNRYNPTVSKTTLVRSAAEDDLFRP